MPRRTSLAIALAACAFALVPGADTNIEIQLMPAGDFRPSDGRSIPVPHWHIDQAVASKVIARFAARKNPAVVDYEHQTLHRETNGQPAPAAAWINGLVWREGQGLFGTVSLTARARQAINDGEYLFVSPVFTYDRHTGDVLDIQMAALTNTAAIDGMEPLALRAAATFGITLDEETPMNKSLLAICTLLALAGTTTEDEAIAALTARINADPLADIRKALGAGDKDKPEALVAACTALKSKAEASSAEPDPAKFVPVSVLESVKTDLAALTAKVQGADVDALVSAGLEDGRLLKAQEDWARKLGASDIAALTAYLGTAQPIAALNGSQTGGKQPIVDEANGLNAEQLAVCSATGIDPKDFAAAAKAA